MHEMAVLESHTQCMRLGRTMCTKHTCCYHTVAMHHIQDEGSFPLLVQDWGAIEEVLLLDAVEQDGFGNWYDYSCWVWWVLAGESIVVV